MKPYQWTIPYSVFNKHKEGFADFVYWIKDFPDVLEWSNTDSAFRAPAEWPESVARAFDPYPPCTPHRIANAPLFRLKKYANHNVAMLLAYAGGVPVELIAKMYDTSSGHVIKQMRMGVRELLEDARFVVWLVRLDWTKIHPPAGIGTGLVDRLRRARKLKYNPLECLNSDAVILLASPQFKVWATSKAAMRIDDDTGDALSITPPREKEEE